jgi:hypothetical protein
MATAQVGHDVVTTTLVSLAGVAVFAILAGMSDNMGKLMLILMWGFVLGWFLLNYSQFKTMVSAL